MKSNARKNFSTKNNETLSSKNTSPVDVGSKTPSRDTGKLKHSDVTVDEIREASANRPSGGKARFTQPASDYTMSQNAEAEKSVKPNRGSDVVEPGMIGPHEKSQAY